MGTNGEENQQPRSRPRTGGLQQENCEPITVMPGRAAALLQDISKLLDDFEASVRGKVPLRTGAFPIFRGLFIDVSFSLAIEKGRGERTRDVFQFACGSCWQIMMSAKYLQRRVGVVFLVYLLFHTQHPYEYAVPVDMAVMDVLVRLRRDCLRQNVFLECPEILRNLAATGALSIGIVASCRNLYFDLDGRGVERMSIDYATSMVNADAEGKEGLHAQRLRTDIAEGREHQLIAIASAASSAACLASASSSSQVALVPKGDTMARLATYDGQTEIVDFRDAMQSTQKYDACRVAAGAPSGAATSSSSLDAIGTAVSVYQRDTPPQPNGSKLRSCSVEPEQLQQCARRSRRKRRVVADRSSDAESVDPLRDLPADSQKRPCRLRGKHQRTSRLVGLESAIRRLQQPAPLAPSSVCTASKNRQTAEAMPRDGRNAKKDMGISSSAATCNASLETNEENSSDASMMDLESDENGTE